MKKLLVLTIAIIFLSSFLYSQDIEPSPLSLSFTDANGQNNQSGTFSADKFPQKNFILTWQWAANFGDNPAERIEKITDQLFMNTTQNHNAFYYFNASSTYTPSQPINTILGLNGAIPFKALSMQYSPVLEIKNPGKLEKIDDSFHSVWGFKNINSGIVRSSGNPVLELYSSQSYSNINEPILSEPWDCTQLTLNSNSFSIQEDESQQNPPYINSWNGQSWYLSINLSRLNNSNTFLDNQTVLSITMPYTLASSSVTGLIKFDALPTNYIMPSNRISLTFSDDRGIALTCATLSQPTATFNITTNMIPLYTDAHKNITLSAHFYCNNNVDFNPYLKPEDPYASSANKIDSLKISVYYHGSSNCDVGINWIRIENPRYQKLARGYYDTKEGITNPSSSMSLHDVLQRDYINKIQNQPNFRLFRLYAQDGWDGDFPTYYHTMRYLNKLCPGMWTASLSSNIRDKYSYHVEPSEKWLGIHGCFKKSAAAPYYRSKFNIDTMGYIENFTYGLCFGVDQSFRDHKWYCSDMNTGCPECGRDDSLKSGYETWYTTGRYPDSNNLAVCLSCQYGIDLPISYLASKSFSLSNYWDIVTRLPNSLQSVWETVNHAFYLKNSNFYYDSIPWWSQIFLGSNWRTWAKDTLIKPEYFNRVGIDYVNDGFRPQTGEETRLTYWSALTRGTKGFCIDRIDVVYEIPASATTASKDIYTGIGYRVAMYNSSTLTGKEFIYSNDIGDDFIKRNNDPLNLDKYIAFDSASNFLGVTEDRIFLGLRSPRTEMYKTHAWIKNVDSILMRLRLACVYSKGFKTWYDQDPKFSSNNKIIKKFIPCNEGQYTDDTMRFIIDTSKVRLRPIGRTQSINGIQQPYYQAYDSAFLDITILRDKDDNNLDGSKPVYLGVVNRRTDPLLYWTDLDDTTKHYMKFLSTAEFDDSCHHTSRNPADTATYKSWFWKRLGSREISIPFNVTPYDTTQYTLLRISELGADNAYLNNQDSCPWRKPEFYHKVDTIIGQDKNLVVRLLPGEGKILKVEVLKPDKKLKGSLAYSNQRKLISSPIYKSSGEAYKDSIYYHLVYHRYDSTYMRNRVFYCRSKPINKTSKNSNIIWENEICLSNYINCNCSDQIGDTMSCVYPSIVVRFDSVADKNKVYVVFSCKPNQCDLTEYNLNGAASNLIVESVFNADDSVQTLYPLPCVLTCAQGYDINKWGVPMINASSQWNYYCWSDSASGIGTNYKVPSNYCFNGTNHYINFQAGDLCTHPSLNSYSRINLGENECALTWQEEMPWPIGNGINYTRLKVNTSNVVEHYLPDSIGNQNPNWWFNNDTSFAILDCDQNGYPPEFPIVYRGLEDDTSLYYNNWIYDVIAYQFQAWDSHYCSTLSFGYKHMIAIGLIKTSKTLDSTRIYPFKGILSNNGNLYVPNISQGDYVKDNSLLSPNNSNQSLILEFSNIDICTGVRSLWHYPHNYYTLFNLDSSYYWSINSMTNIKKIDMSGDFPQLAARPNVRADNDWWKNRRVIQTLTGEIKDSIKASSQHFYKGIKRETIGVPFLGFNRQRSKSLISVPLVNGNPINFDIDDLYPELKNKKRKKNSRDFADTIFTNWFKVPDNTNLTFKAYGLDTDNVEMKIEYKNNRSRSRVLLRKVADSLMENLGFLLINGRNDEYRLVFFKKNPLTRYSENVVLMDNFFSNNDNDYEKVNPNNLPVIDLGGINEKNNDRISLSIYPNPADEQVYVTAFLPYHSKGRIILKLYSALGIEVARTEIDASSTTSFATGKLPAGAYFIRAEEKY
ncbi:MAG: hypothetical protein HW421_3697 [Ignavibacteria bacterium]|nr:hypothetical protein [Ignavibacteria bacterium]